MVEFITPTKPNSVNNLNYNSPSECILGAIDIGTNSIHMVVVKIDTSLPSFSIIAKEKDTVRLGDRDPKTGNLTQEAMARSLAALSRCKDLAASLNVDKLIAVATSATRESPNGEAFLAEIAAKLGIKVDLISGQEEARRIYLGVLSGMEFKNEPHVIIDIGGGSTELILGDGKEARYLSSTKVGAVRLAKKFITSDPISEKEYIAISAYVRGMLERAVDGIWQNLEIHETPRLVGTSGTIETLAIVHALTTQGSEPNPLSGYQVSRTDLERVVKRLVKLTYKERADFPGISDKRAEIIVPGAIILLEAMKMLKLDYITICERALREGVIVDWMLSQGYIENRLRYQGEVRKRNIYKIARKYSVDLEYAERVAKFALDIFAQTKGILHDWGDSERELLEAAAILHNCGLYINHSAHHKHSYYLIRNAEILGFTEIEIELIANIARYHRKSKPKKKHEQYQKLSKINQAKVSQLSAILRIASALDRRMIGAIKSLNCIFKPAKQELILELTPANVRDDCALELWNLNYKKDIFEQEYNVKLEAILL